MGNNHQEQLRYFAALRQKKQSRQTFQSVEARLKESNKKLPRKLQYQSVERVERERN